MNENRSSPDSTARFEQMINRLKEHEFRLTPQRVAVLKILAASKGHPSVEQIYEQVRQDFPTTSLATVYKTVALLRELGEVLELGFPDGSNRYDGNKPFPHPHVICTMCRTILDPDLAGFRDLTKEISDATGFRIITHRVDFFGLCRACQKAKPRNTSKTHPQPFNERKESAS